MKYLAALAAVVVALFGTGSPAVADAGWQRIPCFSGAIERAEVTGGDYLTLTGYLDCGRPGTTRYRGGDTPSSWRACPTGP
jgi:hypothetical protein